MLHEVTLWFTHTRRTSNAPVFLAITAVLFGSIKNNHLYFISFVNMRCIMWDSNLLELKMICLCTRMLELAEVASLKGIQIDLEHVT